MINLVTTMMCFLATVTTVVIAEAIPAPSRSDNQLSEVVGRAVENCVQIKLPNSLARPTGFDIDVHVETLKSKQVQYVHELTSPEGIRAIERFLNADADELKTLCALEIGAATKRTEVLPILQRFSTCSSAEISRFASRLVAEWPRTTTGSSNSTLEPTGEKPPAAQR